METTTQVKGIMIMKSYYEAIKDLNSEDQLIMFTALMEYGFNGIEPNFEKPYLKGYWKLIQPTLSHGISNYLSKVNNGKKGGLAKAGKVISTATSIKRPYVNEESSLNEKTSDPVFSTLNTSQEKLITYVKKKGLNESDEAYYIKQIENSAIESVSDLEEVFALRYFKY